MNTVARVSLLCILYAASACVSEVEVNELDALDLDGSGEVVDTDDPLDEEDDLEPAQVADADLVAGVTTQTLSFGVTIGSHQELTRSRRPAITFTASGAATTFLCRFDTASLRPCESSWYDRPPTSLADGWHTFQVYVRDATGSQRAHASLLFRVDATRPVVTLDAPPPATVYIPGSVTLRWRTSEPVVQTLYRLTLPRFGTLAWRTPWIENQVQVSCTQTVTNGVYTDWLGIHSVDIAVQDAAGNWGYAHASWTCDRFE